MFFFFFIEIGCYVVCICNVTLCLCCYQQARFESLGVGRTVSQLRQQVKEQKSKSRRHYKKKVYGLTPLRRSLRISNNLTPPQSQSSKITFTPSRITSTPLLTPKQGLAFYFFQTTFVHIKCNDFSIFEGSNMTYLLEEETCDNTEYLGRPNLLHTVSSCSVFFCER